MSHDIRVFRLARREEGAIGWLVLGILIGIAAVIYGVYELVT